MPTAAEKFEAEVFRYHEAAQQLLRHLAQAERRPHPDQAVEIITRALHEPRLPIGELLPDFREAHWLMEQAVLELIGINRPLEELGVAKVTWKKLNRFFRERATPRQVIMTSPNVLEYNAGLTPTQIEKLIRLFLNQGFLSSVSPQGTLEEILSHPARSIIDATEGEFRRQMRKRTSH